MNTVERVEKFLYGTPVHSPCKDQPYNPPADEYFPAGEEVVSEAVDASCRSFARVVKMKDNRGRSSRRSGRLQNSKEGILNE